MKKRIISFVLVIVLSLGILPTFAFAATSGSFRYTVSNDKATVTDYTGSETNVVIPSTLGGYPVTQIGEGAFEDCYLVERVTVPEGVTTINARAFNNCLSLKSIDIPSTVISIVTDMFSNCVGLTDINIHPDNTFIVAVDSLIYTTDMKWLIYCALTVSGEVELPDGVERICSEAFKNCTKVESVVLPDSVESIDDEAFYGCTALESIALPDSVTSIGDDSFYNTAYYNNENNWQGGVFYVGNHLIQAKTNLTSCFVKTGTKTIAKYAFYCCDKLVNVTLADSVKVINSSAFGNCTLLRYIKLSSELVTIDNGAFRGCVALESIEIPCSTARLGDSVFADCTGLKTIKVPDSLLDIGKDAFYNTAYYNNSDNWEAGILYLGSCLIKGKNFISYCNVKDGTKVILPHAFEEKSIIARVILPEGMQNIPSLAFDKCKKLKEVTLPASIKTIEEWAFLLAPVETVYYSGTHEQYMKLDMGDNENLSLANWIANGENVKDHVYDNACDTECICGEIREVTHDFGEYVYNNDATYEKDGTKTAACSVCGETDTVTAEGTKLEQLKNGWVYEGGWVYYENGVKLTNCWLADSVGWCYVGTDGYCVTNQWMADSIGWCYLNSEGRMATNRWIMDSQGWCYVGADGYCVTNQWMADSIGWCYLDSNGRMATNQWIMDSQGWCYVGADGYCLTNCWMADSVGWCYLDGSGRMVVNGWVQDSYGLCWLDESGYWDGIYY